VNNLAQTGNC